MMAISLWQPWASLVSTGAKKLETRSWPTKYRGPLAIHAAARKPIHELLHTLAFWHMQDGLAPLVGKPVKWTISNWAGVELEDLPFGAIVAVCVLTDCRRTDDLTQAEIGTDKLLGDFTLGRYAWRLENVQRLSRPIPCRGRQGFFNVTIPELKEAA